MAYGARAGGVARAGKFSLCLSSSGPWSPDQIVFSKIGPLMQLGWALGVRFRSPITLFFSVRLISRDAGSQIIGPEPSFFVFSGQSDSGPLPLFT